MAKLLPYFKFNSSEWNDGDISFESFEVQGLFISICSLYWSREGDITLSRLKHRLRADDSTFQALINWNHIKVDNDNVHISFLEEQLEARGLRAEQSRRNGSKGGRPKKNPEETQEKPTSKPAKTKQDISENPKETKQVSSTITQNNPIKRREEMGK